MRRLSAPASCGAAAFLLYALMLIAQAPSTVQECSNRLPASKTPQGFCPYIFASSLDKPRGIAIASNNDVLVVEKSKAQVTVLYDSDKDGVSSLDERAVLAKAPNINHAVIIHEDYLYASSASTVYRWRYTAGQRSDLGTPSVVVDGIPTCCDHVTRALLFDSAGLFYVQLGSGSNVDHNSNQARIKRWNITHVPDNGFDWGSSGELFADGLRNEVNIRMDKYGLIWGVENGIDNLHRASLGGDIHKNNPSEELNLFDPKRPGLFYGYPYCWSQYDLPASDKPIGTQWATEAFLNDGTHTDAWCQNVTNVIPPKLNMQAHYAPLDLLFYYYDPRNQNSPFPSSLDGDLFVTAHGSWNRQPPVGFKVLLVDFENRTPVSYSPFLEYEGPGDRGHAWPHRPVALGLATCGQSNAQCLLVTSDATGVIIAVTYEGSPR